MRFRFWYGVRDSGHVRLSGRCPSSSSVLRQMDQNRREACKLDRIRSVPGWFDIAYQATGLSRQDSGMDRRNYTSRFRWRAAQGRLAVPLGSIELEVIISKGAGQSAWPLRRSCSFFRAMPPPKLQWQAAVFSRTLQPFFSFPANTAHTLCQ